ncbi:MAG: hypothetical protein CVV47_09060 [Spirochaetae bacterium HGW-Spirochaetae-3]|jgi:DedD protein|nr:MAG: hypothetical protein CVV47_09060 [Spirochaetae bacterium HGW-Spirochaetae-3]
MPIETKKVLWTVLSVVIALVVASGIALALAFPRGSSAGAPASVAAVAPPRSASPDEYLRAVEPVPLPPAPAPTAPGSDIIIVYGDKPDSATLPDAAGPSPATTIKPYVPAPSTPAPKPRTAAPQEKPAAAQPASSAAAKPAAPKSVAEYWIQAAAFTSRSHADDLQRDLAGKGLSTLITVKDLDGVTWYRVRIGPYATEREAKGWLEKIRILAGCSEAYVSKQTIQRSS